MIRRQKSFERRLLYFYVIRMLFFSVSHHILSLIQVGHKITCAASLYHLHNPISLSSKRFFDHDEIGYLLFVCHHLWSSSVLQRNQTKDLDAINPTLAKERITINVPHVQGSCTRKASKSAHAESQTGRVFALGRCYLMRDGIITC